MALLWKELPLWGGILTDKMRARPCSLPPVLPTLAVHCVLSKIVVVTAHQSSNTQTDSAKNADGIGAPGSSLQRQGGVGGVLTLSAAWWPPAQEHLFSVLFHRLKCSNSGSDPRGELSDNEIFST